VRYFRNTSPQGALELPLVHAIVPRGGLVAVPADRAPRIEHQDVWAEVDAADALAELAGADDDEAAAKAFAEAEEAKAAEEAAAAAALATDPDATADQPAADVVDANTESADNQGDQS
jgi:hypothetical protein